MPNNYKKEFKIFSIVIIASGVLLLFGIDIPSSRSSVAPSLKSGLFFICLGLSFLYASKYINWNNEQ